MITRLGVDIEAGDWLDDRQFGFRAGRGAEDAVNRLIDGARAVSGRYVMGLFLDIPDGPTCSSASMRSRDVGTWFAYSKITSLIETPR